MLASLNYLGEMSAKPAFYVHDRSKDRLRLVSRTVPIADARQSWPAPALDIEGFCLVKSPPIATGWDPTAISTWDPASQASWADFRQAMQVYVPEIQRLILDVTGGSRAIVTPVGVIRIGERSARAVKSAAHRPARFVHADYSDESAVSWAESFLGRGHLRKPRYAIYNAWRVLTPPPQDAPLALCDARSVKPGNEVSADAIQDYPGMQPDSFEASIFRYDPEHRWSYFSDMTPDEVVVFKGFDSDSDRAHRVPHSAFDNPHCPPLTPARVSVDFRMLVVF